jgi:hypothetical protein
VPLIGAWRRFATGSIVAAAICSLPATATAQVGPGGVAVQIEKYSGAGVVVEPAGMQFRYQDDAGKEYVVSASPDRVFGGVRYGQIDPLDVRIRGAFAGDRLEPGMFVAFHATMSGRRVVEPVERLTIVTPGTARPLGIHDPETLTDGAIFGLFLGQPLKTGEASDGKEIGARGRVDRDAPTAKVVIGRVTKATGLDRFTVSAGDKIDVGASLAEGALLFVDSSSIADLAAGDPVKLEGAKIADSALFAVKIDVERSVPPELLARPEADGADVGAPAAAAHATPGTAGSGVKPASATPPSGAKPADPKAPPAARGRIVEVN